MLGPNPGDPNGLDGDGDGIACEVLPSRYNSTNRTPLIFVPGIGGSRLYVGGEEKWPAANSLALPLDTHLYDLEMNSAGTSKKAVEVGDMTRTVKPPFGQQLDVYSTTMNKLEAASYTEKGENQTLSPFPNDWRRDVTTVEGGNEIAGEQSRNLLEFIDYVREETGSPRVDIMAHSQGGLVTLSTLNEAESVGKVRKVMTLGTPVLGATKALGILQYQAPCFTQVVAGAYCVSNPATVQTLYDNMPAGYQLLPSPAFDEAEGAPLVIDWDVNEDGEVGGVPEEGPQYYERWSKTVADTPGRNEGMLRQAKEDHDQIFDEFTPADSSVELTRVVGSGISTPDHIRESLISCSAGPGSGQCFTEETIEYSGGDGQDNEGGDGTVPLHSADLVGTNQPESRASVRYVEDVKHLELAANKSVLNDAIEYFGEGQTQPSRARSFSAASETSSAFNSSPADLSGVELEAIGSFEGYVEDGAGNVLGAKPGLPEGVIAEEIPGSVYNRISDTQSFFLNEAGDYTGKLEVKGEQAIRVRVRTYAENAVDGQAIFRLDQTELPKDASLQLDFATRDQNLDGLRVRVDDDGDGAVDKKLPPDSTVTGPIASDTDPPETTASYRETSLENGRVRLAANDGDGSRVAETYYAMGRGADFESYEGPFTAPLGTVLRFYSVDRAGNTEGIGELQVGEKPPRCTITGTRSNDILRGTGGEDVICALGGNDVIRAGAGDDTVRGGPGNDVISGGAGDDRVSGGRGNDPIVGGSGNDKIYAGSGNDVLSGRDGVKGNDSLDGGARRDACRADPQDKVRNCEP